MKRVIYFFLIFGLAILLGACGTNDSEKFVGIWTGNINCDNEEEPITITMSLGAVDNTVVASISDFGQVNGSVDGSNLVFDKTTKIIDGDTFEFSGFGSVVENDLTMSLTISIIEEELTETRTCPASFVR